MIRRPWAFWRRVQYIGGMCVVLICVSAGLYVMYWQKTPTCTDTLHNGDERGVDCGGICERLCAFDIIEPIALWADSFQIVDGQYNAVAYIENKNQTVGSPSLQYTFRLYDEDGLITTREGMTVLPPDSVYPIFEGKILTGLRVPTHTTIEFGTDIIWLPGNTGREQFTLERRELKDVDTSPRLIADIRNQSLDEARDVEIVATLFDSKGTPLTASRTEVPVFGGRSVAQVVFTWPQPIAKTLRSCDVPTDVMLAIDLSGSMNNDNANPPQPLTSVKDAAGAFVLGLRTDDRAGLVTYASKATLDLQLIADTLTVGDRIRMLAIDPKEEQGSTNIGDALKHIAAEFLTERHNPEARKVAIVLTDGLATAPQDDPEGHARESAAVLTAQGVRVFTIGLGASLNSAFLESIATDENHYYHAPTIADLQNIYTDITRSICEDGPTVIEIIPKAKTSFREYQ
jgi:Mg-chelatase subunit ChlD